MIKAVIFDMYETLITHFRSKPYFGKQMAEAAGMTAVQAVWYLKDNVGQPCGRKEGFRQIENPLVIIEVIK